MASGYADSVNLTVLTETYLDDNLMKQAVLKYATAAARTADAALTSALREGMVSYQDDTNSLYVYSGTTWSTIGPVHGAPTAMTLTVTQGASVTVANYGGYVRLGRMIIGSAVLAPTTSGTASNDIVISGFPTAAITGFVVGTGVVIDTSASAAAYYGPLHLASTTTFKIRAASGNGVPQWLGTNNFSAALANGDEIHLYFHYIAATDA